MFDPAPLIACPGCGNYPSTRLSPNLIWVGCLTCGTSAERRPDPGPLSDTAPKALKSAQWEWNQTTKAQADESRYWKNHPNLKKEKL